VAGKRQKITKAKKPEWGLILALDYGGAKHSAGVAEAGGKVWLARESIASPRGADAGCDQRIMLKLARRLLSQVRGRLLAVGVSFGGAVDASRGLVLLSHHVPGWEEAPLRDQLQKEFKARVAVENDAHAGALGEYRFGAGKGCTSLLYVTVSTGIGGGWVIDGQIYPGMDGMSGQIGHTVVRPGGAECVCGKSGCLEAEACGPAIARKFKERTGQVLENLTGASVAAAAIKGDLVAQEVMDDAAVMLGTGLGGAINLMNPERVVLGGGVTKSGERWWGTVRATARRHVLPEMRVDIRPAKLGDDAPLWGAVALAQNLFVAWI